MKFRKALIWSAVSGQSHRSLTGDEKTIAGFMPVISTLFPGINYFSVTGFGRVMKEHAVPALKKQFPELADLTEADVNPEEELEVSEVLPSDGYEWQDSDEWQDRFQRLLAA